MEEKLIKQLKTILAIEPSENYKERSLQLIVSTPQHKNRRAVFLSRGVRESVTLGLSLVLASLLLLIVLGGFNNSSRGVLTIGGDPGFDINIGEARYYDNEEIRIEVALQLQRIEATIMNINDKNRNRLLFEFSELRKKLPQ